MPTRRSARNTRRSPISQSLRGEDEAWVDARPNDIVVAVVGPAGVGKSTFVNHVINGKVDETVIPPVIGEDITSCTQHFHPFAIPFDMDGRLVIVDTPGFDDTYGDDAEILRRMKIWLTSSYNKDKKLGGVIYLHDITQVRMPDSYRSNFQKFHALCGKSVAEFIILGTTKGTDLGDDIIRKREKQLHEKFWGETKSNSSQPERFEDSEESAWKMVEKIARGRRMEDPFLQMRNALLELEKIIPLTESGTQLRDSLQEVLQMRKLSTKEQVLQPGGREYEAKLTEKLQLIDDLVAQIELKVPMWDRIKNFFSQIKESLKQR